MKSKFLPPLVMLLAGFVCSILSLQQRVDLMTFTTRLLSVLVIFYIIGGIMKLVLDKAFMVMADKDTNENESKKTDDTPNDNTDDESAGSDAGNTDEYVIEFQYIIPVCRTQGEQ